MTNWREWFDGAATTAQAFDGEDFGMYWLARPLACNGEILLDGLDVGQLTDSDLKNICFRMDVILDTIEMPRCEGRLLPTGIFDRMDTLMSMIIHGHGGTPKLTDWTGLITEFGEYYGLAGDGPIDVDLDTYRAAMASFKLS
ncbi:MAG: hypothetical protein K8T25_21655 [Planctomycetia bacterium]|nr:hypothetical protein [Planctomycetia bacterium]